MQLSKLGIRRAYQTITCNITCRHVKGRKKPRFVARPQSADRHRVEVSSCARPPPHHSLSSKEMAPVINKTLTAIAVAGVGALAYAVYFDHRRRSDPKFRKQLRREKKKLEKSATQTDTSTSASGAGSGELPIAEILAAMTRIKDDQIPTTPEEREKYFMAQVEKGEQLCASGPESAVEAALAFFRALRVYPSPVELIMIFQNTVPEPIFKMVLEMMRLDVSDPPSSTKTDEEPPSASSEEDGSTSNRGPPSETSSQDWDQVDSGSLTPPTA